MENESIYYLGGWLQFTMVDEPFSSTNTSSKSHKTVFFFGVKPKATVDKNSSFRTGIQVLEYF